jgi:hypothetical protein
MALAHELAQSEMSHHPELWKCDGMEKPKWEYTPTLLARAYIEMYNATGDTVICLHREPKNKTTRIPCGTKNERRETR